MSRAVVRLGKELKDAQTNPDPDIHLEPYDPAKHARRADGDGAALSSSSGGGGGGGSSRQSDLFSWLAVLRGPPDTPFEGGTYHLLLRVPSEYPMQPPSASFITKVFHPNVEFQTGNVCLDILKTRWSPAWTLNAVCRAILNLMAEPESDSPFNCDAGNLVRAGDVEGFNSMVRMYAITEAGAPPFTDWD